MNDLNQKTIDELQEQAAGSLSFSIEVESRDYEDQSLKYPFRESAAYMLTAANALKAQAVVPVAAPDPAGWLFFHDETGRTAALVNDGINNPSSFAKDNPRYGSAVPLYITPQPVAAPVEHIAYKLKNGSVRWVNDDAMFSYEGPLYAAPPATQAPQVEAMREAAQAVLDRWNSPRWEWAKQGPTADLIAALRAAIASNPPQPTALVPNHHVGDSKFESWFSEYDFASKGTRQQMRDAYAAGMSDFVQQVTARVPLTETELKSITGDIFTFDPSSVNQSPAMRIARAVEKAHGICITPDGGDK